MKNLLKTTGFFILLIAAMTACEDRRYELITYEANVPVYMDLKDFRNSFTMSEPVEIKQPGKIYFKDGYLFVNEYSKGIHVIDNSDPANPEKIAFYNILGNIDMAICGNILYADSYIDLVAIDISDINNPVEIDRLENVFPESVPEGDIWYPYSRVDSKKGVVVDWKVRTVTEKREVYEQGGWIYHNMLTYTAAGAVDGSWSAGAGKAGSMARFMLNNEFLYLIAHPWLLKTVDTESGNEMHIVDSVEVSRDMETLYRLGDKLFIGTTTGMLIYGLNNPDKPVFLSSYDHITACDPVVTDGTYAYVTLRTGNRCGGNQNLLEVIDISSITNPYLVKSYPMYNPHGLGIEGDLLFICDGAAGLKIYDRTDPLGILNNQLAHFPDIDTYDVIPLDGILMLIGEDGIYQYDYTDIQNIVLISHLLIAGE
ncbi:MAG: hypothetical protein JW965_05245 [Bacteroidales bacterium]|nr:hypothetical protein [Bacteroidales bacterium]